MFERIQRRFACYITVNLTQSCFAPIVFPKHAFATWPCLSPNSHCHLVLRNFALSVSTFVQCSALRIGRSLAIYSLLIASALATATEPDIRRDAAVNAIDVGVLNRPANVDSSVDTVNVDGALNVPNVDRAIDP